MPRKLAGHAGGDNYRPTFGAGFSASAFALASMLLLFGHGVEKL
jgi:hypothetical protein